MSDTKFSQILEKTLRKHSENQAFASTAQDSEYIHMSFLMGQMSTFSSSKKPGASQRKSSYPPPKREKPCQGPPPMIEGLTPDQQKAYDFFWTYGIGLSVKLTAQELKRAFRKAALKLHPDRGGSAVEFIGLKQAVTSLQSLTVAA